MLDETLADMEATDDFFKSLQWPDFKKDPDGAAQSVDKLLDYLELNTMDYFTELKQALKKSDKHEGAYVYCKKDFKNTVEEIDELLECLADFRDLSDKSSKNARGIYRLIVAQFKATYNAHSGLWDAVYEKNQLYRVDKAISTAVKSYRKGMDTMRSRGRLLMQRQEHDKSKRYPRQEGSDKHGFFQLPSKTDPTSQHHELLEEVYKTTHPMEKVAAIEKYILDPNAKGSFYQQSFKMKLVQAINNGIFAKDIDGLKKIIRKMSPNKVREIFSENAGKWHQHHFPNYDLPQEFKVSSGKVN